MGFCVDFSPSDMMWVLKIKGPLVTVVCWLFILCGVNDKADSRANSYFERGQELIDMRYLR